MKPENAKIGTITKSEVNFQLQKIFILLIAFVLLLTSCTSEDDITKIIAQEGSAVLVSLNNEFNCTITGNISGEEVVGSLFSVAIPYSSGANIFPATVKVVIKDNDGTVVDSDSVNFNNIGSEVIFNYCLFFGDSETKEVVLTIILIDNNGLSSNPSLVTIQRPEGAN